MANKRVEFRYPLRYSSRHLARPEIFYFSLLFFIIIFNDIGNTINNMEYNVRQVLPETSLTWINRQEIRQRDNSNRLSRLGAARRISSPAPGSALRYS